MTKLRLIDTELPDLKLSDGTRVHGAIMFSDAYDRSLHVSLTRRLTADEERELPAGAVGISNTTFLFAEPVPVDASLEWARQFMTAFVTWCAARPDRLRDPLFVSRLQSAGSFAAAMR